MLDIIKKTISSKKIKKSSEFTDNLSNQLEIRCKSIKTINELYNYNIFKVLSEDLNIIDIENILKNLNVKIYYNEKDKVYGFYNTKNGYIYINFAFSLNNPKEFAKTVVHEKLHEYTNDEIITKNNSNFVLENFEFFSKNDNKINAKKWLKNQFNNKKTKYILLKNNKEAKKAKHRDNRTIFVHGTFSDSTTFKDEFIASTLDMICDYNFNLLNWSGKNTKIARKEAAKNLLKLIDNEYEYKKDEIINLVGHSHGGNVIKEFTNIYDNDYKIRILNYATPNRPDYKIEEEKIIDFYNIYHKNDNIIQGFVGGFDFWDKPVHSSKTTDEANAINIEVHDLLQTKNILGSNFNYKKSKNFYDIHVSVHSKINNDNFVKDYVTLV